jgi:hypothetical protein
MSTNNSSKLGYEIRECMNTLVIVKESLKAKVWTWSDSGT